MNKRSVIMETRAVTRQYMLLRTRIDVLRGVDLSIYEGERLSIMGASGAGKSTLLHILGGLDRPTSGNVIFKGHDLFALGPRERTRIRAESIGYIFQAYHLIPELTVLENVLVPRMRFWNWFKHAARYKAEAMDWLERVGLKDRAEHRPAELSGGEQQRVAIARALINEPHLIFADEPTGNLDSATGDQVLRCLFDLSQSRQQTLVVVTHNEAVAERCDRTIHLRDGRVAV